MADAAVLIADYAVEKPKDNLRKHRYYPGLDGLRGLAILAVFFSHYSGGHTNGNALAHLAAKVMDAGWIGVDLFFVLSGFLITGILMDTAHDPRKVLNFYARRSLRIFPVFYGVLGLFLLLTPVLHIHWRLQHLLYFFYLSNMMPVFFPHATPPGFGVDFVHFWSLAVEEQFYLVWPLIVWRLHKTTYLLKVGALIMLGALLLRIYLVHQGVSANVIYQTLPTRADSLIAGSMLALWVDQKREQKLVPGLLCLLSGAALIALFVASGNSLHSSPLISSVGYTVLALFFTCLVYFAQLDHGWIRRLGTSKVLRFFGRYSYGLYIYHGVLIIFLVRRLGWIQTGWHQPMLGGAVFVLLSLGISLSVAMLSYRFVEKPFLRYKRYFV